jgi:hypothetical protein
MIHDRPSSEQRAAALLGKLPYSREVMMKIRKPTKGLGKIPDAILASRYGDLRRLRDEVRKAETICARRRSKNPGLETTSSMRLSDQEFVDFLS